MRLAQLHIRSFRGLQDVQSTLGERGTVLIGANDAGTSMILDAIRYLFGLCDRFFSGACRRERQRNER